MPYTKEITEGKRVVKINTSLTIYDVPALHEALIDCFDSEGDVMIDVGEVTECDAAGIQLLCAIRKNIPENRQSVRIIGESDVVMETMKGMGLDPEEIIACPLK